jgi:hypothetical protein
MSKDLIPYFSESALKYDGSAGGDVSIGVDFISAIASSGMIWIVEGDERYKFNYRSVGASYGLSLPVSMTLSLPQTFSDGIIYANTFRNKTLGAENLTGPCFILQGEAVSWGGAGGGGTALFMSVGLGLAAAWVASMSGRPELSPLAIMGSCRAVVFYAGVVIGVPNAGVSCQLGYLTIDDAKFMKSAFKNLGKVFNG